MCIKEIGQDRMPGCHMPTQTHPIGQNLMSMQILIIVIIKLSYIEHSHSSCMRLADYTHIHIHGSQFKTVDLVSEPSTRNVIVSTSNTDISTKKFIVHVHVHVHNACDRSTLW